jgi:hypothetical protein
MRSVFPISLVIVMSLFLVACNGDPRDMTYGRFRRLPERDRLQIGEELSEKELQNIMAVATSSRYDSATLDRKTLSELIAEGEKVRRQIESTPPTR